jgi:hypothetical protein
MAAGGGSWIDGPGVVPGERSLALICLGLDRHERQQKEPGGHGQVEPTSILRELIRGGPWESGSRPCYASGGRTDAIHGRIVAEVIPKRTIHKRCGLLDLQHAHWLRSSLDEDQTLDLPGKIP